MLHIHSNPTSTLQYRTVIFPYIKQWCNYNDKQFCHSKYNGVKHTCNHYGICVLISLLLLSWLMTSFITQGLSTCCTWITYLYNTTVITLISQKLHEHCGANHSLRESTHINNKKITVILTLLKCSNRILSFAFCIGSLGCNGLSGYFSSR